MLVLALTALLAFTQAPCPPEAAALVEDAAAGAVEFDLDGAAAALETATARGCATAAAAALYLRGLVDARDAFRQGGPPESLASVRQAIVSLERLAQGGPPTRTAEPALPGRVALRPDAGPAEIARLMLHAAAAAAQSERDEMRLYLEAAIRVESRQRAAGQPGAPVVSAAEIAGDLWLQVHRYEEARRSYMDASEHVGATPRVISGLARVAARLNDTAAACGGFMNLLEVWGSRPSLPAEILEARAYLRDASCTAAGP